MTITPTGLIRAAGLAAVAAGALFIGVQINHPHMDAESVGTTEVVVRDCVKIVMAALALAGITGMYARDVRRAGVLGLVGYLLLSVGYLVILGTTYVAAFVLPAIAVANPGYVDDVTASANTGSAVGDIGLLAQALALQGAGYLLGGLLFGIALYRAGVLSRWGSALLAAGGVVSAALTLMPDAFHRVLAFPNGIAMIALGWSLWRSFDSAAEASDPSPAMVEQASSR